jgi:hypothetical protein
MIVHTVVEGLHFEAHQNDGRSALMSTHKKYIIIVIYYLLINTHSFKHIIVLVVLFLVVVAGLGGEVIRPLALLLHEFEGFVTVVLSLLLKLK